MDIRPAVCGDLPAIEKIYAAARAYMTRTGNPTQWAGGYPPHALLREDIARGDLYVCAQGGRPCGVFALIDGDDETYAVIEDGAWLNGAPYGTLHRVAADGSAHGVFAACLAFCRARADNLRADTHADNRTMRHLLEKHGFVRCGVIHVQDGSARIAYQLPPQAVPAGPGPAQ